MMCLQHERRIYIRGMRAGVDNNGGRFVDVPEAQLANSIAKINVLEVHEVALVETA